MGEVATQNEAQRIPRGDQRQAWRFPEALQAERGATSHGTDRVDTQGRESQGGHQNGQTPLYSIESTELDRTLSRSPLRLYQHAVILDAESR